MKKSITLIVALLYIAITFAQNEFINYKAVVKDDSGNLVTNQSIGVQFTVLEDAIISFVETHAATTDANGIVILNIGEGTATTSTFDAINWTTNTTLKTEIDIDGGLDNLVDMGTTEFKSVPYALNASNVSGLELISENGNAGWRLIGAVSANHGDIGNDALDLSTQLDPSTSRGATGIYSIAFGANTQASGIEALATGSGTLATGSGASAFSVGTKAESFASTAIGMFNIGGGDPISFPVAGTSPLFEIGNGMNSANRSNALTVLYNGNVGIGTIQPGAALDIESNSTLTSGQINLKESSAGFTRINMTNTQRPTSYWAIASFLGVSNATDQLNFYNSDVGDIMSLKGTGDVQVSGEIQRTTTGTANLLPIAYGSVNSNGTIAGGTGNFTVTYDSTPKTYEVNVTASSLSFSNSTVTINPIFGSAVTHGFSFGGSNPGDDFTLTFRSDNSGSLVSSAFQFVIYQN